MPRIWSGVPRYSFRASILTYSYRVSAVQENVPVPRGGNIGERMKGFSYRVSAMEFLALGFGVGGKADSSNCRRASPAGKFPGNTRESH